MLWYLEPTDDIDHILAVEQNIFILLILYQLSSKDIVRPII